MDKQTQSIEKKEGQIPAGVENTGTGKTFVPRVDILETEKNISLIADMPGVDEKSVDITLERRVLAIRGPVAPVDHKGYSLAYTEYEIGDYYRSFSITDEIDKDNIEAVVKNGVLRVLLPKVTPTSKRITVKTA